MVGLELVLFFSFGILNKYKLHLHLFFIYNFYESCSTISTFFQNDQWQIKIKGTVLNRIQCFSLFAVRIALLLKNTTVIRNDTIVILLSVQHVKLYITIVVTTNFLHVLFLSS